MSVTLFGVLTVALCLILLWSSNAMAMLRAVLFLSLMGGSAALVLTGLGGSTVQPAILALGILALRLLLPQQGYRGAIFDAFRDSTFLAIFVVYGIIGAMLLPRIFAGTIEVTPLRPIPNGYIYAAYPLAFSPQNITSSVYLLCTLLAAWCGNVVCRGSGATQSIARNIGQIAAVHAVLGLMSLFLAGPEWSVVQRFFRNGNYAQLDQTIDGISRMTGILPEAAVFAAYGISLLVFTTELWLRDVETRWAGAGALLLATALLLSTSSTAYAGLTIYAAVLTLRLVFMPGAMPLRKSLVLTSSGLSALAGILALLVFSPAAAEAFGALAQRMTISKVESASALQRAFWARHGVDAFAASYGLGVGPGSFRSSSLATAVLGSTGVIGTTALLLHLGRVFRPLSRSTYFVPADPDQRIGAAAAWAALIPLFPASLSAASPDPGYMWGFFCGMALALRHKPAAFVHKNSIYRPTVAAL